MFLVELIASSFLDLISKQVRLNSAVSVFLLVLNLMGLKFCIFRDCKKIAKMKPRKI